MLAFIVGLQAEGRLLAGRVFVGGGGAAGAAEAAAEAVDAGASALVSFGLAGGLSPSLAAGEIVVARSVMWQGRLYAADAELTAAFGGLDSATSLGHAAVVEDAAGKAALWRATQAAIVDLESGAVAEAAGRAGLPFGVLRAVCDPAWRTLPPAALLALDPSGQVGLGRVMGSVMRHPGQIGGLLALARDAARARRALAVRVASLQASGALQKWD